MERVTKAYLDRTKAEKKILLEYAPPKVVLCQVAERLVRHRRLREAPKHDDLRRWQTHMGQWLTGTLKEEDGMVRTEDELPPATATATTTKPSTEASAARTTGNAASSSSQQPLQRPKVPEIITTTIVNGR